MPKITTPLSDAKCRSEPTPLRKPTRLADGKGLFFEVRTSGQRVWLFRFRDVAGRQQIHTIGDYGDKPNQFTLAAARLARAEAESTVGKGQNPTTARVVKKRTVAKDEAITFAVAAERWFAENGGADKPWRPQTRKQYQRTINDLLPTIGKLPLSAITPEICMAALARWNDKKPYRSALRMTISRVYRHHGFDGELRTDPTYFIRSKTRKPKSKNHPFLYMKDVPAMLAEVRAHPKLPMRDKIAVQLCLLSLVRTCEVAGAKWDQFDIPGRTWYIPAGTMKMDTPHIVPLTRQHVELLRELRTMTGHTPYLFPLIVRGTKVRSADSRRGDAEFMAPERIGYCLRQTSFKGRIDGHGLRGTASTFLNGFRKYRGDVVELQLAHLSRKDATRADYNHAALLDERRPMMQFYADACMPPKAPKSKAKAKAKGPSNVIQMRPRQRRAA